MQATVEILYDKNGSGRGNNTPVSGTVARKAQHRSDTILVIIRASLTICVLPFGPPTDIVSPMMMMGGHSLLLNACIWAGHAFSYLISLLVQPITKDQGSNGSKYAENHGDGLSQPDSPWN